MRLNVVLIGPPGSGKGTQAIRLAKRYRVPHISTGDMLRQAVRDATPLGLEVAAVMARGELVSDGLMAGVLQARLDRQDAAPGFILDGFPRTVAQVQTLDEALHGAAPLVVHIDVPEATIISRLSSRRVCRSCSITQSTTGAALQPESCPYCGGTLVRRDDDEAGTVRRRLSTYATFAQPVLSVYRARPGFVTIDGQQPPDRVTAALIQAIGDRDQKIGS